MSDHFPGEITIGGDIPRRLLDELVERIASEGVSIDWQYTLDKAAVQAAIENAASRGETVRFTDDEACYGQFEELEGFLVKHGIHFDRHSDARYEYDGENAYCRGGRRPIVMPAGQSGDNLVRCRDVLEILNKRSLDDAMRLRAVRRLIRPPETVSLTPIRFV